MQTQGQVNAIEIPGKNRGIDDAWLVESERFISNFYKRKAENIGAYQRVALSMPLLTIPDRYGLHYSGAIICSSCAPRRTAGFWLA